MKITPNTAQRDLEDIQRCFALRGDVNPDVDVSFGRRSQGVRSSVDTVTLAASGRAYTFNDLARIAKYALGASPHEPLASNCPSGEARGSHSNRHARVLNGSRKARDRYEEHVDERRARGQRNGIYVSRGDQRILGLLAHLGGQPAVAAHGSRASVRLRTDRVLGYDSTTGERDLRDALVVVKRPGRTNVTNFPCPSLTLDA